MSYTVRTINRDFTPSEAAEVTGVSPALQRDWRRRGILPENEGGKWTRWTLYDVIKLAVMKRLSDSGVDVSKTLDAAAMAILPTLSRIEATDGAVAIEGDDVPERLLRTIEAASDVNSRMADGSPGPTIGAYLFIGKDIDSGEVLTARLNNMAAADDIMARHAVPLFTVIDCAILALEIFDRAGRTPLIRREIEATGE